MSLEQFPPTISRTKVLLPLQRHHRCKIHDQDKFVFAFRSPALWVAHGEIGGGIFGEIAQETDGHTGEVLIVRSAEEFPADFCQLISSEPMENCAAGESGDG
jgi:hypothetical protein